MIVPGDRELLAEQLADTERWERNDALGSYGPVHDRGRGGVTLVRRALDHELGRRSRGRGLDADARNIARVKAALEARSEAHHDRRAVRALHTEEQTAGLGR